MVLFAIHNPYNLHRCPLQTLTNLPLHFHPFMFRPRVNKCDLQLPCLPAYFFFPSFVASACKPNTCEPSPKARASCLSPFLFVELDGEKASYGCLWGAGGRQLADELAGASIY